MIDGIDYDRKIKSSINNSIYIVDGQRCDAPFPMHHNKIRYIQEMIETMGFSMEYIDGDWSGDSFCISSKRTIFKLQKLLN